MDHSLAGVHPRRERGVVHVPLGHQVITDIAIFGQYIDDPLGTAARRHSSPRRSALRCGCCRRLLRIAEQATAPASGRDSKSKRSSAGAGSQRAPWSVPDPWRSSRSRKATGPERSVDHPLVLRRYDSGWRSPARQRSAVTATGPQQKPVSDAHWPKHYDLQNAVSLAMLVQIWALVARPSFMIVASIFDAVTRISGDLTVGTPPFVYPLLK
jgi:hypothetical protein